jgi:hypothetical protein
MLEVIGKLQKICRPVQRRAWRVRGVQVKEVLCCLHSTLGWLLLLLVEYTCLNFR